MVNKEKTEYEHGLKENFKWFALGMGFVAILYALIYFPFSKVIGHSITGFLESAIAFLEDKWN